MIDLNQRAKEVHAANAKWWHDLETGERLDRNKGELLMLCISEVAEAMEGERKGGLPDDKLTHRPMAEVEMADTEIRLLDFGGGFGIEITTVSPDDLSDNRGEALFTIATSIADIGMASTFPLLESDFLSKAIANVHAYCDKFGYDLEGAYQEKMAYNAVREDHKAEARRTANGKKW